MEDWTPNKGMNNWTMEPQKNVSTWEGALEWMQNKQRNIATTKKTPKNNETKKKTKQGKTKVEQNKQRNYFSSSDPHHDMSGEGC